MYPCQIKGSDSFKSNQPSYEWIIEFLIDQTGVRLVTC